MFNPAIGVLFIYYLYITEHTSEKCSSIIQIDEHFFYNKFIYKYVGEQLLDTYRVTFFGHRDFNDHRRIEGALFQTIRDLLISKVFVEFYIGRNGEFDRFCASVIKRVQDAMGKENSELILVLPYTDKDIEYYEKYYDYVMIPETIEKTHPKRGAFRCFMGIIQPDRPALPPRRRSGRTDRRRGRCGCASSSGGT